MKLAVQLTDDVRNGGGTVTNGRLANVGGLTCSVLVRWRSRTATARSHTTTNAVAVVVFCSSARISGRIGRKARNAYRSRARH